jgi:hypothetical protein
MPDASTFSCPRCGTLVSAGATRCPSCARQGADATARDGTATKDAPGGSIKVFLALGCLALVLVLLVFTGSVVFFAKKLRETQQREGKREMQRVIDEERRRYEAEQAQKGRRVRGATPTGELAALARALPDLAGQLVSPATTLEHGGVVVVSTQGCEDCLKKLAGAEKVCAVARRAGLGAQFVLVKGTREGVEADKVPASLRACIVLDEDGKVGEALRVNHMTAFVVDSDGSSVVYRGDPESAIGMVSSVAQGE